MIRDIYHSKCGIITFKKILYNSKTKKLEYTLKKPIKNSKMIKEYFKTNEIYKHIEFKEKHHNCCDLINFLNDELDNIQNDIERQEKSFDEMVKNRDKIFETIKNLIYIENDLYKSYKPLKKDKYFIKIIWGNMFTDRIIQKTLLNDIICDINKENKIYLKILDISNNNIFYSGIYYLGWELID